MISFFFQIVLWFTQAALYLTLLCLLLGLVHHFFPRGKISNYHRRYVLITGCDSGFGKEIAICLDKLGFHVFATCLTSQGEDDLKAVSSSNLKTLHMDVTKSETIQDAFEKVKQVIPSGTGLWGLVNNAGVMMVGVGPVEWLPLNNYKRCADINLWGLVEVTKTFLPLVKQAKGRVTNFASTFGRGSPSRFSAYCITKYGVEAFSDALRREMRPYGVRVSIIEPGPFKTGLINADLYSQQMNSLWKELGEDLKSDYGEEYLEKQIKVYDWMAQNVASADIHKVVEAVTDSLTSRSPHTRYTVGNLKANQFIFVMSWLPTELGDWLIRLLHEDYYRRAMNSK